MGGQLQPSPVHVPLLILGSVPEGRGHCPGGCCRPAPTPHGPDATLLSRRPALHEPLAALPVVLLGSVVPCPGLASPPDPRADLGCALSPGTLQVAGVPAGLGRLWAQSLVPLSH